MPESPQNWPFPNRVILGLDRDTPLCEYSSPWSRLLNRHECVVYPCKSCFGLTKGTQPCDTPMLESPGRVDFLCGSIFSVFGPFLTLFTLLCSPKYKT
ncbi:RNA polymerase II transcription factor B subunit 3 [Gossypium arboreum]|uniref:RNA polymerase II transcription factor B subunit 3 n=1 Tax=Gossypium arboreum TaxID=29729 RepID=A0A0B0P8T2_GOSAR|nr:RNA polymerase II transcription factor B subunit 3 [Gossypium arboreum]